MSAITRPIFKEYLLPPSNNKLIESLEMTSSAYQQNISWDYRDRALENKA